jgi:hypothetical protein
MVGAGQFTVLAAIADGFCGADYYGLQTASMHLPPALRIGEQVLVDWPTRSLRGSRALQPPICKASLETARALVPKLEMFVSVALWC